MKRFVLGEFTEPDACVQAARKLREGGVRDLDAYSPYPLHGIDAALDLPRSKVPVVALTGGVLGAIGGYALQWYLNSRAYPINVGNRPAHGFWTNIPITFESGVLIAVLSIFFSAIFYFFRLPRTYHPVFESERFRTASLDAFWISAETADENAVPELEKRFREAGAHKVHTVVESV
jgi:Alternative complex III, ActD subunit